MNAPYQIKMLISKNRGIQIHFFNRLFFKHNNPSFLKMFSTLKNSILPTVKNVSVRIWETAVQYFPDRQESEDAPYLRSPICELIDGNGKFNVDEVKKVLKEDKLIEHGSYYVVVSIIGPQSSGKSTLLNHLFGTHFKEMDFRFGRNQTTKGIWFAKSSLCTNPPTLVMDLEGTDGSERGQDDITFEKQSALFALAVSDVVLINIWCNEIGREQAANRPLLRSIFQARMRLSNNSRKTTLMFVIRDKLRTPFELLERKLIDGTEDIWNSVPKPRDIPLYQIFSVEVVALSNYEDRRREFMAEVKSLRTRFSKSMAPVALVDNRSYNVPFSAFSLSVQEIWKLIKEDKDLDLPAHTIMMATMRCQQIADELYNKLEKEKQDLIQLKETSPVPHRGFGKKLHSIIKSCLSEYDKKVTYFNEEVRNKEKKNLDDKLRQLIHPAFQHYMQTLCKSMMKNFEEKFKDELSQGTNFNVAFRRCKKPYKLEFIDICQDDGLIGRDEITKRVLELVRGFDELAKIVRSSLVSQRISECQGNINKTFEYALEAIWRESSEKTWELTREAFEKLTQVEFNKLARVFYEYDLDEQSRDEIFATIKSFARGIIVEQVRAEKRHGKLLMNDAFSRSFNYIEKNVPRRWESEEQISSQEKVALSASCKVLSNLAAIRLDDNFEEIDKALRLTLLDDKQYGEGSETLDLLASANWNTVPSQHVILSPKQCCSLWKEFAEEARFVRALAFVGTSVEKPYTPSRPQKRYGRVAKVAIIGLKLVLEALNMRNIAELLPHILSES